MNQRRELLARLERLGADLRRRLHVPSESRAALLDRFGGVTLHQLGAVRELVENGPLTMNELAARIAISPSAATQLVDRLVQHDLVHREPDADDRRVLRVAASGHAADAAREFETETRERFAALVAPLSDKELSLLASLLQRLVDDPPPEGAPR